MFSLEEANISLRRRFLGLSLAGGVGGDAGVSTFSRPGFLRVVRFMVGLERLSRRDEGAGSGAREDSAIPMSSTTISSCSESEASFSDMTRGEPTNGASRLMLVVAWDVP